MTCLERFNVQELSSESPAPLIVMANVFSCEVARMNLVLSFWGMQQKDLPHAVPHFDSVPSLSRDSDVGDLSLDLFASSRDPSGVQRLQKSDSAA